MTRLSTLSRSIAGKVALVTGAASGMGRATAHLFADEGAHVAVTDLDAAKVQLVVDEIKGAGGSAEGWTLPLSDRNARKVASASSSKVVLGARHSTIKLHKTQVNASVPAKVYTVEPTGDITFVQAFLSGAIINISLPPSVVVLPDEMVWLEFDQDRIHLFDGQTEMALHAD